MGTGGNIKGGLTEMTIRCQLIYWTLNMKEEVKAEFGKDRFLGYAEPRLGQWEKVPEVEKPRQRV